MDHCAIPGSCKIVYPTPAFPVLHGTRLCRQRLYTGVIWRKSRILRKPLIGTQSRSQQHPQSKKVTESGTLFGSKLALLLKHGEFKDYFGASLSSSAGNQMHLLSIAMKGRLPIFSQFLLSHDRFSFSFSKLTISSATADTKEAIVAQWKMIHRRIELASQTQHVIHAKMI